LKNRKKGSIRKKYIKPSRGEKCEAGHTAITKRDGAPATVVSHQEDRPRGIRNSGEWRRGRGALHKMALMVTIWKPYTGKSVRELKEARKCGEGVRKWWKEIWGVARYAKVGNNKQREKEETQSDRTT